MLDLAISSTSFDTLSSTSFDGEEINTTRFDNNLTRRVREVALNQMVDPALKEFKEFKNKKVLLWDDTEELVAVVGNKYRVVPHTLMIESARDAILTQYGREPDVKVEVFSEGAKMKATFSMPWLPTVKVADEDESEINFQLFNSYDTSWAKLGVLGLLRFVCTNGSIVGDIFGKMRFKGHNSKLDSSHLGGSIQGLVSNADTLRNLFINWQDVSLSQAEIRDMVDEVKGGEFSRKHIAHIVDKAASRNKWEVYNEFTHAASHMVTSSNRREQYNRMIANMFFHKKDPALV